jgi:hypothetical protein
VTWNLTTISAFYESQRHNPFEFNRLCTADPVGRIWTAHQKAVADFNVARHEHQGLGSGAISSDAPKTAVLEGVMTAALVTRDIMIAGIQAACAALGDAEEPSVRYFQRRPGGETAMIAVLESLVTGCGV